VFARRTFRPVGVITKKHLRNEFRVIARVCGGGQKDVVKVLGFGELSSSSHYYLDMELCDMNLENFIQRKWTAKMELLLPYMTTDSGPRMRTVQIWNIMEDTSNGLAYIHGLNEIHRDLKPRNSMSKDFNC
jgi:serine/threonine protein kinase